MFDDLTIILFKRTMCLIEYQLKINLPFYVHLISVSYFVITDFIFCFMKTFPVIHCKVEVLWRKVDLKVSVSNLN